MAGAYGTPCSGEIQFWSVMQSSARAIAKELKRANKLKAAEIKLRYAHIDVDGSGLVVPDQVDSMVDRIMEVDP